VILTIRPLKLTLKSAKLVNAKTKKVAKVVSASLVSVRKKTDGLRKAA